MENGASAAWENLRKLLQDELIVSGSESPKRQKDYEVWRAEIEGEITKQVGGPGVLRS